MRGKFTRNNSITTIAVMLIAGSLFFTKDASAGLKFCNYSSDSSFNIAIGYYSSGDWYSEGWWNMNQGKCITLITGKLTNRKYYVHAKGRTNDGDENFCTLEYKPFKLLATSDCNGKVKRFTEIDTGESTSYTYRFYD